MQWWVKQVSANSNKVAVTSNASDPLVIAGPYDTQAKAQTAAHWINLRGGAGGSLGTIISDLPTALKAGEQAATPSIPNPLTGVDAIGDFFHRLTESSTWVRVGEVALGGILVYAGLRALTHGSTVAGSSARKSVTKPVRTVTKKAAKAVVPEARLASRVVAKRAAPKTTAKIASHRAQVKKYGGKTPYRPPKPTVRVSHVYHHSSKPKPKKVGP
jgi:hypothetical protein